LKEQNQLDSLPPRPVSEAEGAGFAKYSPILELKVRGQNRKFRKFDKKIALLL
jgi:hypothetical protein